MLYPLQQKNYRATTKSVFSFHASHSICILCARRREGERDWVHVFFFISFCLNTLPNFISPSVFYWMLVQDVLSTRHTSQQTSFHHLPSDWGHWSMFYMLRQKEVCFDTEYWIYVILSPTQIFSRIVWQSTINILLVLFGDENESPFFQGYDWVKKPYILSLSSQEVLPFSITRNGFRHKFHICMLFFKYCSQKEVLRKSKYRTDFPETETK